MGRLPTTPPARIADAIAIHASPSVITSIRIGTRTSVYPFGIPMGHPDPMSHRSAILGLALKASAVLSRKGKELDSKTTRAGRALGGPAQQAKARAAAAAAAAGAAAGAAA